MGTRVNEAFEALQLAVLAEVSDQDETSETLGEALRTARNQQSLSLQNVADRAGMSKAHIWEMERGGSVNPTIAAVSALAAALGIPFRKLAASALLSYRKAKA